jgi:hypothetical protein
MTMGTRCKTYGGTKVYLYECNIHKHNPKLEWLDEHLPCFVDRHAQLPNLSLLRVCKQAYDESRLIPYAANTFVFIAPPSFEKFLHGTLSPAHLKALRSIAIWSPMGALPIMDEEISWRHWTVPAQIQCHNLLSGLQHLTLNFSIYDEVSLDRIEEVHSLLDLSLLAGSMLRKVHINVTLNEAGRLEGEAEVDARGISTYIETLSDAMLQAQYKKALGVR